MLVVFWTIEHHFGGLLRDQVDLLVSTLRRIQNQNPPGEYRLSLQRRDHGVERWLYSREGKEVGLQVKLLVLNIYKPQINEKPR